MYLNEINRSEWVWENGKVLLFCPGCGSTVAAEYDAKAQRFTITCKDCDTVYDVTETNADLYAPSWP